MNSEQKKSGTGAGNARESRGVFPWGFIIGIFVLLIDKLRSAFVGSGLFQVLTGGTCSDKITLFRLPEGKISRLLTERRAAAQRRRMKFVRTVSIAFENSKLLNAFSALGRRLLATTARAWGVFFAAYGLISAAVLFLRSSLGLPDLSDRGRLIGAGVILGVCAVLLFCSEKQLISLIASCVATGSLFCAGLDFLPEKLRPQSEKGLSFTVCAGAGALLALASFFADPTIPLSVLALAVLLWLILLQPELGVVISVAAVPFTSFSGNPDGLLCGITLITLFAYALKRVTCRRAAKFEKIDLCVLAVLFAFLSGIVYSFPGSVRTGVFRGVMLLSYFLFVLMMRDRTWLRLCSAALIFPAAFAALVNIAGFLTGLFPAGSGLAAFAGAFGGISFVFDTPGATSLYLTMVLPFAFAPMISGFGPGVRIPSAISAALILADVLLLHSGSAWLGLLCGVVLFVLLTVPRSFAAIPPLALIAGLAIYGFSDIFGTPLARFLALPEGAVQERGRVWSAVLSMIRARPVIGYGLGEDVFRSAYTDFAAHGAEGASCAFSLYLDAAAALGVFGLLVLLFALMSGSVSVFSYLAHEKRNSEGYLFAAASVSALLSVLVTGIFSSVWADSRVFFLFWLIAGFASAAVRTGRDSLPETTSPGSAQAADTVL